MATSNQSIFITFAILIASILFLCISDVDQTIQDFFYNFEQKQWIVDPNAELYKAIFYYGAKKFLITIGILFMLSLFFYKKFQLINQYKKGILIVILSSIIIVSLVGALKATTNMPCPEDELRYGGRYPKTAVWECYPEDFSLPQIRCWPAGHASGGFALMSLFFLFKKKRNRYIGLAIGLSIGWITGGYKMVTGDHFFSHTWVTMVLAWLIIIILARIIGVEKELNNE